MLAGLSPHLINSKILVLVPSRHPHATKINPTENRKNAKTSIYCLRVVLRNTWCSRLRTRGLRVLEGNSGGGLRSLPADAAGQLDVLGHDRDPLGVDGAEVGVLEETNHVGLGCLLEGKDGRGLETELASVLRGDFTDESLEWEFSDEELGALLESSDLTESNSSWSESVGLLDTSGGGGLLGSSLVSDVLSWVLGSGVLAGSLLGAGHFKMLF